MSITTEIGVDMMLGIANPTETVKRIEKAVGSGVEKGLTGGLASNQKSITESYSKALVGALRLSNKEAALNMEREFKARSQRIEKEAREIQRREGLLERAQSDFIKKKLRERIEGSRARIREEQKALKEMAEKQQDYQRESLEMLDKGMEKAAKNFGDRLEDSVSGFQDLLSSAMGDPSEFIKKMSSSAKESSSGVFTFGAKMAAGGGKMAGMGKLIMGLGKLLPILAGVGAAVAGIVAVFMAAYGQAKEFNKTILEGSSAVDLLASDAVDSSYALSQSLADLRQSAMGVAYDFRATSEEVLGLATAMNDANFTFEEQRKVFGSQSRAMKQALVATQAFGVAGGEIATMVNTMVEDFAYGQSEIASGFQDIFGAAQMSGLGIKNFFTAISEATSGMALYNFRLEDTLELFVGLEKILGEQMGKDVLMGARDKFKEMGTQDRLGFRMKMGKRAFNRIAAIETAKASAEFNTKFFSQANQDVQARMAKAAPGVFKDGMLDAKALGKLGGAEIGGLQNILRDGGLDELATQLGNLARVGKGGGALMGEFGAETALAADLAGAVGYLGETLISEMSEAEKMNFEQNQGISGTMLKAYEEIQNAVAGRLSAKKGGGPVTATEISEAIASGNMLTKEEREKFEQAQKDAAMTMEEVADQQLKETRNILDTLKNVVARLLEGIYDGIMSIPGLGGGPKVVDARASMDVAKKAVEEFQATGDADADRAALKQLEARARFEELAYQGALKGQTRQQVFSGLTKGMGLDDKLSAGLATMKTGAEINKEANRHFTGMGPEERSFRAGQALSPMSTTEYDILEDESKLTNESLVSLLAHVDEQTKQGQKDAKQQTKATDKTTEAVEEGNAIDRAQLDAPLRTMLGEDFDLSDRGAVLKALRGGEGGFTQQEKDAFYARFPVDEKVDDFIYRGDSRSGTITPIDSMDSFFGAKPGGAIDKALRGGRGVTINNLIINESGNPQKTLQMVKQAIKAAKV